MGSTHYKQKPWSVVTSQSTAELLVFKKEMVRRGIRFSDGMESIEFNTVLFNEPPVVSIKGKTGKVNRASYQIRILSMETLEANRNALDPAPEVVVFVSRNLDPTDLFGSHTGMQMYHLAYIDELADIAYLIL